MDILFLHGNYPAQFRLQAAAMAADPRHRVVFATEREEVSAQEIPPGLKLVTLKPHRPPSRAIHPYLFASEEAVLLGQAVVLQLVALQERGFRPRLVVFHAGRGLGLFLRTMLPEATLVAYSEWYFKPADLPWLQGETAFDSILGIGLRNQVLLQELVESDLAIVPTEWQRQQFPAALQPRLEVVFDGVDTDYFKPADDSEPRGSLQLQPEGGGPGLEFSSEAIVLSYTTRGMEPLRGFPEFLRALPGLLASFPQLEVVVAGRDRQAYSYAAPSHGGSWKEHLLAELGDFPGRERLHFTGLIPYGQLRALMQRTDLHVYLTRPYVTSWSLFQAAACGAPIAMNTGPATTGVLPEAAFASLDLDAPDGIEDALHVALQRSLERRGQPRRSLLPEPFALPPCQARWQELLNQALRENRLRAQGPRTPCTATTDEHNT